MQSLWGCAYDMRSLGDVNYKITNPSLTEYKKVKICTKKFFVLF
jgi:hypothetical protein